MAVGMLSLVYARTQALHARRQADAANLAATLEVQQAMADRMYRARLGLTSNPRIMALYLDANPEMRELYPDVASVETTVVVRNIIDALQDMYFLRKTAIVGDHFWRNWMASFGPVARMPRVQFSIMPSSARRSTRSLRHSCSPSSNPNRWRIRSSSALN
jgi:hypothetical protein